MTDRSRLDLRTRPHRRFNPLTREWVLVSPHRTQRPWQGQVEPIAPEASVSYDPSCYLCPGNLRSNGARNPMYGGTFVFDNDFPALRPDDDDDDDDDDAIDERGLLVAQAEQGVCRVICYAPQHDLAMARMDVAGIRRVVDSWVDQYRALGSRPGIATVQIFENRGAMMGASNPHPHGQAWASSSLTNEMRRELDAQAAHYAAHSSCLLCDYLALESRIGERIVCANEHFAAVVPFWAVWPYETLVLGRRHTRGLDEITVMERDGLAAVLGELTARYDALFGVPFPYSMGFHQRPTDGTDYPHHHLHAHFYPPLLRSATVRKFMVGYELLGTPQRDITPETAAEMLRGAGPRSG